MPGRTNRYAPLLDDPDVSRWNKNLARGSQATADNYLRIFGHFLDEHGLSPRDFARMNPKKRDDLLADHIDAMLERGRTGSTAAVVKKSAVSWLEHNGEKLTRKIKIPGASDAPTQASTHTPSPQELRRVLNASNSRARAAIGLMAFSGVRPEVLGNYKGDDGLRLRDLEDLKIGKAAVEFSRTPCRILVRPELTKTRRSYFSFVGPEGCEYIQAYLQERMQVSEKLGPDSPAITPLYAAKPFIRTVNISDLIRKPMRAAGLKEPPYVWRSYFDSRAMLAESKGLLRDYRQFFMGHKGDIEHVYTMRKQFTPDRIEAMRKAYETALEFLETLIRAPRQDPTIKMLSYLLQSAGYSAEQVEGMNLESKSQEEIVDLLRRKKGVSGAGNGHGDGGNGSPPRTQRVVAAEHLDTLLTDGWEYRTSLPDGRVIVEHDRPLGS